eukprot:gene974-9881_t
MVFINESSQNENPKSDLEKLIKETDDIFDSTEFKELMAEKTENEKEIKKSSSPSKNEIDQEENSKIQEISEKENEEEEEDDDSEIEKEVKKLIPNLTSKKKDFYFKWYRFMESIHQLPDKLPIMGFKPLDLFNLYHLVISQGGYEKVNKLHGEGVWIKIFKKIDNYKSTITNASVRLKKYYHNYLLKFETKYFDKSSFNSSNIENLDNIPSSDIGYKIIGRVSIDTGSLYFEAEIYDTNTGKEFISKLPFESKCLKSGDFFYLKNEQMNSKLEKLSKQYFKDGELFFNPREKEILFCFGKNEDIMEEEKDSEKDENYEEEEEENEEIDEEKKLNSKCNLFGKISTNQESIPKVKESNLIKMKLISNEQKKKRQIKLSDPNEPKKKRVTRQMESKNISSISSSMNPILSLKYKYEGELDSDSKLIKTEIFDTVQLSSKDIQRLLIEDNVNFDELNEIRYYEYSDDEDSEGWALMTDKFSAPIENKTKIKLKLRKGELQSNQNIFKRKTNQVKNYTLVEDADDEL